MKRILAAFSWLRWRILVNGLRGGHRRDTIERVSRVAMLVVPGLIVATTVSSVFLATALGGLAGWRSVVSPADATEFLPIIRLLLLVATTAAVLVPLAIGAHGGSTGHSSRLLLLPLSARDLHLVQLVSGLTDPWVLVVLPGLLAYGGTMFAACLVGHEAWTRLFVGQSIVAIAGAFGVTAGLGILASVTTLVVSWVVRDRRRSEAFVILFILGLTCVAMIPALFSRQMQTTTGTPPAMFLRLVADPPVWMAALPSEIYGAAVGAAGRQDYRIAALWLLALFGECGAFYLVSAALHRRVVEALEGERGRRHRALAGVSAVRIPGMWPGTSAVAIAQVRTALRSVRGRLVVLLPAPVVAMFALILRNLPGVEGGAGIVAASGPIACGAGLFFGLYAAQAFTLNQFASDRAGLTLEFLAPIRDIDLVRGKTAGCAALVGAGGVLSILCALAMTPHGSAFLWLTMICGAAAAYVIVSPATSWLSVVLPVPSDLSKTGMAGNPHSLAMLAGSVLTAAAALPTVVAILVCEPPMACLVATIWLGTTFVFGVPLLDQAARVLRMRRENLALIAQGKA